MARPETANPLAEPSVPAWFNPDVLPPELLARRQDITALAMEVAALLVDTRARLDSAVATMVEVDRAIGRAIGDADEVCAFVRDLMGTTALCDVLTYAPNAVEAVGGTFNETPAGRESAAKARDLMSLLATMAAQR